MNDTNMPYRSLVVNLIAEVRAEAKAKGRHIGLHAARNTAMAMLTPTERSGYEAERLGHAG